MIKTTFIALKGMCLTYSVPTAFATERLLVLYPEQLTLKYERRYILYMYSQVYIRIKKLSDKFKKLCTQ